VKVSPSLKSNVIED